MKQVIFHISSFQHLADKFQHTLVMDTNSPEFLEQQAVIDIVEASLDVALNGPHGWSGDLHPAFMTLMIPRIACFCAR